MKLLDRLTIRFHILFGHFFVAMEILNDCMRAFGSQTRCVSSENVKSTLKFFSVVLGFLLKLEQLCHAACVDDFRNILSAVQNLVDVLASSKSCEISRANALAKVDNAIQNWMAAYSDCVQRVNADIRSAR